MSTANVWINNDGLRVPFGARTSHNIEDARVHTYGRESQAEVRLDHTTVATLATGVEPTSKALQIPAGSAIKSATLVVLEGFTDLTSIVVGTKGADGVTEDADGLITSTLLAALTAGATIEGSGAQVLGDTIDKDLYVSLDITGTAPTAGEAHLLVEYLQPVPSSEPPAVIVGEI